MFALQLGPDGRSCRSRLRRIDTWTRLLRSGECKTASGAEQRANRHRVRVDRPDHSRAPNRPKACFWGPKLVRQTHLQPAWAPVYTGCHSEFSPSINRLVSSLLVNY